MPEYICTLFLPRHLLTQLSHICPDGGHSLNPENNVKMGSTKPQPVLAMKFVVEVFNQIRASKKANYPSGKDGGNSFSFCPLMFAFPCANLNLVFRSLLHCKSESSILNTLGTLSTSTEKGPVGKCHSLEVNKTLIKVGFQEMSTALPQLGLGEGCSAPMLCRQGMQSP